MASIHHPTSHSHMNELKQDMPKREAQLTKLGDAYADFKQDIECLTTRRDDNAWIWNRWFP